MSMSRTGRAALCATMLGLAGLAGCTAQEPQVAEAPPFTPTEEAKKEPEGKPKGYGSDSRYEDAMRKQFGGGNP